MITASRHLKHYIFLCNPRKPCSSLSIPRFPIFQSKPHGYNNCITSITVGFPLPFFTIISNFIGKYQLLTTQASTNEEIVTDEVLNQILTSIENSARPKGEICTDYVDKLCRAGNLSAAARLLQSLNDKHIFLSPKAYNFLLRAASERHDIDLLSHVFKVFLVSSGSLSSACYANVAKAFTKTNDDVHLLRFVKEVSALTSPSATVVNRILFAFAKCGQVDKALLIYFQLKSLSCKPDLITYNTILDILGRAGRTDEMLHEFVSMKKAGIIPDIVSYNTLLNNLRKVGRHDICLVYFREMGENGVEPDLLTYTALIESSGRSGNIEESIRLFKEMKMRRIRPSIYVYRSLVNHLKKMGKVDLALKYLEEMNSSHSDLAGPKDFKRK
uniref:Pentacotripeptide-repeat region of PRORP domain-containing protein n=1 Tax=Fagus sylvatica TaxID=28930 RepID=A0A2N9IYX4_FAGSY